MIALAAWLVHKAGWNNINLTLSFLKYEGWDAVPVVLGGIALVVSYFSGPMLNFGDFSRYGKDFTSVKRGNFWGLPVNFLGFALLTVITTSATLPVFGEMISDPVAVVARIDNITAVVLGALTFMIATIGINIVANFVSPAFDFSNVAPQHISWRTGGMIAAVASIFITPWNLYNNPAVIHYTIDVLGAFIGPLFGILIADYYFVQRQQVHVDDLYTLRPTGRYWYRKGYNPAAVWTLIPAALIPMACVVFERLQWLANYSWFIGVAIALVLYTALSRKHATLIRSSTSH
jgi:NCS1 family nucleobase:cation symporter-1